VRHVIAKAAAQARGAKHLKSKDAAAHRP
jgi:hypothetical protein